MLLLIAGIMQLVMGVVVMVHMITILNEVHWLGLGLGLGIASVCTEHICVHLVEFRDHEDDDDDAHDELGDAGDEEQHAGL